MARWLSCTPIKERKTLGAHVSLMRISSVLETNIPRVICSGTRVSRGNAYHCNTAPRSLSLWALHFHWGLGWSWARPAYRLASLLAPPLLARPLLHLMKKLSRWIPALPSSKPGQRTRLLLAAAAMASLALLLVPPRAPARRRVHASHQQNQQQNKHRSPHVSAAKQTSTTACVRTNEASHRGESSTATRGGLTRGEGKGGSAACANAAPNEAHATERTPTTTDHGVDAVDGSATDKEGKEHIICTCHSPPPPPPWAI